MSLIMTGRVVYVKPERSSKGTQYKRLQVQMGGEGQRVRTEDVTDMSNSEWSYGEEYQIPVDVRPFQGKRGLGLNWTCWDGPMKGVKPMAVVAGKGGL